MKAKFAGCLLIAICLAATLPLGLICVQSVSAETTPPGSETTETLLTANRLIVPFYYIGDPIGTLRIRRVGIHTTIYQGDSQEILKLGAGHYTGSFLPGQGGNILIAGHRTRTKFLNFKNLKIGDLIDFSTSYGQYYYKVEAFKIIEGDDQSIADETDTEQLTLYTCYPFFYKGTAPKRYVVICNVKPKPVVPGNLSVQALSTTSNQISWDRVESAYKYQVYRASAIDGPYTLVSTRFSTIYTNRNLKPGVTYFYKVRAYQVISRYRVYGDFTESMAAGIAVQ